MRSGFRVEIFRMLNEFAIYDMEDCVLKALRKDYPLKRIQESLSSMAKDDLLKEIIATVDFDKAVNDWVQKTKQHAQLILSKWLAILRVDDMMIRGLSCD